MVCSYTVSVIFFHISDYKFFLTFHDGKIGFRSERNGQYFYRTSKDHNWKRSVKMSKAGFWKEGLHINKKQKKNELAKMDTKCSQKLAFCIWELKKGKIEFVKLCIIKT